MNKEKLLNNALNKALITQKIKQPNSNNISEFVTKYMESNKIEDYNITQTRVVKQIVEIKDKNHHIKLALRLLGYDLKIEELELILNVADNLKYESTIQDILSIEDRVQLLID